MYDGTFVKLAITFAAREMLNVHTVVVPQEDASPPQLANCDNPSGMAVSVTIIPSANVAEHVGPQLMPEGIELTVPPPAPCLLTCTWYDATHADARLSPASADQRTPPAHVASGY